MSEYIQAAVVATALTSGAWYLLMMFMAKLYHVEREVLRQEVTTLKDTVVDLEARVRPFNYELRADGVNVIVERGRSDLEGQRQKQASKLSSKRGVVWDNPSGLPEYISLDDIDDIPKWEGEQ